MQRTLVLPPSQGLGYLHTVRAAAVPQSSLPPYHTLMISLCHRNLSWHHSLKNSAAAQCSLPSLLSAGQDRGLSLCSLGDRGFLLENYSIEQSEADTILFTVYAGLCQSGYSGPVVIDAADTDVYVAASVISRQLPAIIIIRSSGFLGQ